MIFNTNDPVTHMFTPGEFGPALKRRLIIIPFTSRFLLDGGRPDPRNHMYTGDRRLLDWVVKLDEYKVALVNMLICRASRLRAQQWRLPEVPAVIQEYTNQLYQLSDNIARFVERRCLLKPMELVHYVNRGCRDQMTAFEDEHINALLEDYKVWQGGARANVSLQSFRGRLSLMHGHIMCVWLTSSTAPVWFTQKESAFEQEREHLLADDQLSNSECGSDVENVSLGEKRPRITASDTSEPRKQRRQIIAASYEEVVTPPPLSPSANDDVDWDEHAASPRPFG